MPRMIPEEMARKEKVREQMQEADNNDMSDINALFKEFLGDILENGLEAGLEPYWMTSRATASTVAATRTPATAATGTAQKR